MSEYVLDKQVVEAFLGLRGGITRDQRTTSLDIFTSAPEIPSNDPGFAKGVVYVDNSGGFAKPHLVLGMNCTDAYVMPLDDVESIKRVSAVHLVRNGEKGKAILLPREEAFKTLADHLNALRDSQGTDEELTSPRAAPETTHKMYLN
jgi:hypothetical protein